MDIEIDKMINSALCLCQLSPELHLEIINRVTMLRHIYPLDLCHKERQYPRLPEMMSHDCTLQESKSTAAVISILDPRVSSCCTVSAQSVARVLGTERECCDCDPWIHDQTSLQSGVLNSSRIMQEKRQVLLYSQRDHNQRSTD